jgi:uncharacterized OB-fold protein
MTYAKPLPRITDESKPFWDSVKAHAMALPWCLDCGLPHYYPQALCPHCWSANLEYRTVSGRGTLYSFCVVARPPVPAFKEDVPYVVCVIDLAEGPRMMSTLGMPVGHEPTVDMEVQLTYDDVVDTVTLPRFVGIV